MNSKVQRKIKLIAALLGVEEPCSVNEHVYDPTMYAVDFHGRRFLIDKETGLLRVSVGGGNAAEIVQVIEAMQKNDQKEASKILRFYPHKTRHNQVRVEVICDLDVYRVCGQITNVDNFRNINITTESLGKL